MPCADWIEDLGCDVDDDRKRFRLTYRNKQTVKGTRLSIQGVLAGQQPEPIVVNVRLDGTLDSRDGRVSIEVEPRNL